jgi:ribonuclease D
MPGTDAPTLLADDDTFRSLVERAFSVGELSLDCEFHGERRYRPTLYLVQLNAAGELVAVDPTRVDLTPLRAVLESTSVRKLFHAGREDLRLLVGATGATDVNDAFDTQIAAAFLGHGPSIGYAKLVKALLDVDLDKSNQYTDWSGQLTPQQIEYALNDVRHLPELAARLRAELDQRGRLDWALQACRRATVSALADPDPRRLYRRISGAAKLSSVELGVLRELCIWRDTIASTENSPPESIASDAALRQLACRPPTKGTALRGMRGVGAGASGRYWAAFAEAVDRGRAEPEPVLTFGDTDVRVEAIVALLGVVRRVVSIDHDIAGEMLASTAELRSLAEWHLAGKPASDETPELLLDWRNDLIGKLLVDTLDGNVAVKVAASAASGLEVRAFPR